MPLRAVPVDLWIPWRGVHARLALHVRGAYPVTDRRIFRLAHSMARAGAKTCIDQSPDGYIVEVREPTRNLEQNALLWVLLDAFSEQIQWPVNGAMSKLSPDEWKDVLSAAFKNETQRVAMGLNGGMVILGLRTSKLGKRQFAEFLEFVQAVAADRGVVLDEVPA